MTEFEYSDAAHGFRLQVRSWIADNIPDGLVDVYDWASPPLLAGGNRTALDAAVATEVYQAWQQRLLSAALICLPRLFLPISNSVTTRRASCVAAACPSSASSAS